MLLVLSLKIFTKCVVTMPGQHEFRLLCMSGTQQHRDNLKLQS